MNISEIQSLSGLEPRKVFQFFREICSIPHGSGNTKAVSDYCVRFAKERGLTYYQDERNNVIIMKDAAPGYETAPPVIIQGHMDMVCEKEAGVEIDFTKDGLDLYVDGDFLKARGTTLGGDDGIAVAYALAVLSSEELAHPALEVVITVDEEIGLLGADAIDVSMLKGKRLLNIDSNREGIFLTGCAGGLCADCALPVTYTNTKGTRYRLKVSGLKGGHSGEKIHKERANAIIIMGRALKELCDQFELRLETLAGGLRDNVIPREVNCSLVLDEAFTEDAARETELFQAVKRLDMILKKEFQSSDKDITVVCRKEESGTYTVLDHKSLTKVLFLLRNVPYGVQNMSMDIPGLVESSLNPGILELNQEELHLSFSVRSSVSSRKYDITDKLRFLTEFLGGSLTTSGDYPAWEYKPKSGLRDLMFHTYMDLFGKEPKIQAIHAGLECGIFSGKIEGLDCISFGPDNFDIHTPQERLSISSTGRVWKLLTEFLRRAN